MTLDTTLIERLTTMILDHLEQFKLLEEQALNPSKEYMRKDPNWKNDIAQRWRQQTGIELIYNEPNRSLLNDLWDNWNQMPDNLKKVSDQKSLELFGMTNQQHYTKLSTNFVRTQYDGYRFVLHKHNPRNGSIHADLRFMDLKNNKLLHSFAVPIDWVKDVNLKTTIYKTRDHDPRWLDLKSYRLETLDEGYVDYKVYRPSMYFELDFHGKVLNGVRALFKLRGRYRDDIWLITPKKRV